MAFSTAGRHFVGFAVADADIAFAIAGDNQGAKAEGSTALDDLGATIDSDDGGFDAAFVIASLVVAVTAWSALPAALAATSAAALAPAAAALAPAADLGRRAGANRVLAGRLESERRGCGLGDRGLFGSFCVCSSAICHSVW